MEPTKKTILHPSSSTPISIGNFQIMSEPHQNSFQISLSKSSKIQISVVEEMNNLCVVGANEIERGDYNFVLANPNDSDNETKDLLKEVLNLYMKELPAMNYAANTGKESRFLEKCLTNGKYCSLVLKSKEHVEVIAAITYQIIPADTQYAEVPLAAVSSICQRKGFGHLLYSELRNRLLNVGIRNVLCWGDKESEGFWLKQGFMVIGKVNKKGRAQRLPIKADIRKTLCFPGDSTLMVSHLSRDSLSTPLCLVPMPTKQTGMNVQNEVIEPIAVSYEAFKEVNHRTKSEFSESEKLGTLKLSSNGSKKRTWEASRTSLKSKKVKGTQLSDFQTGSQYPVWTSEGKTVNLSNRNDLSNTGDDDYFSDDSLKHSGNDGETNEECRAGDIMVDYGRMEIPPTANCIQIMLMNIADDNKKSNLTKVIEDLGGVVTYDGSLSTHVITGKVRKTLNFCTALCSGSWIVSSGWLKESFKKGKFVDETPFILDDEEYKTQYRTELICAVLRAKANPNSLLKGLDIWLSTHFQPPARTLSAIVKCAGGNVIKMSEMKDVSKTIFVACEEDMEEARLAVKLGTWTFSVDWLMNCIMKQELDFDAPQFAESL